MQQLPRGLGESEDPSQDRHPKDGASVGRPTSDKAESKLRSSLVGVLRRRISSVDTMRHHHGG